jgi:hypothetical protein
MSGKTTFVLVSAVSALVVSACAFAADRKSESTLGSGLTPVYSSLNATTNGIVGSGVKPGGIVGAASSRWHRRQRRPSTDGIVGMASSLVASSAAA